MRRELDSGRLSTWVWLRCPGKMVTLRSVYPPAQYISPQGKLKSCALVRPGFTLLYEIRLQGRHREGHEVGFDGVARSELSCQPVVLSDPEADP